MMDILSPTEPELFGFILTASRCVAGRLASFAVQNQYGRRHALNRSDRADRIASKPRSPLGIGKIGKSRSVLSFREGVINEVAEKGSCEGRNVRSDAVCAASTRTAFS